MEGYLFGDKMEIFDLYNKEGQKLNKTMVRGQINRPGEYHRVVHIWIKRPVGDYLIQQRNKSTDKFPYQWAPTAGAINQGEHMIDGALRETYEEIGLKLNKDDLNHLASYPVETDRGNYIVEQFLVFKDVSISDLTIDPIEVKQVKFASIKEIEKLLKDNLFWDYISIDPFYMKELERRFI